MLPCSRPVDGLRPRLRLVAAVAALLAAFAGAVEAPEASSAPEAPGVPGAAEPEAAEPFSGYALGAPGDVPVVKQWASLRGNSVAAVVVNGTAEGGADEDLLAIEDFGPAAEARRLQLIKAVYCVCRMTAGHYYCGGMFYSILQCSPQCPSLCHRKGYAWESCSGTHVVSWLPRLHIKFTNCPDSPI